LATGRVERRLAAILAADVAGYSSLMSVDEEGTHERLKAHLRELVDPKIEEYRGRVVKNTGAGLLAGRPVVRNALASWDTQSQHPESASIEYPGLSKVASSEGWDGAR
jgi:adenylate cyclase